jgi:hypothetical protein
VKNPRSNRFVGELTRLDFLKSLLSEEALNTGTGYLLLSRNSSGIFFPLQRDLEPMVDMGLLASQGDRPISSFIG